MPEPSGRPRVLAVLVAHDGEPWLPETLEALHAQTYEPLQVVAVDNGSRDGTRELLIGAFGADDLLVAERDLGFGAAVAMAVDAVDDGTAEWLLLVHDDLVLAPDAVERLVEQATADPRVAVVGPKLVAWDEPDRLVNVGMSIDLTGRADAGLEPDERDQGQRDHPRSVLYVSTAGMLVRRDVFARLGGFDRRYHLFRDDLDLCWRARLAGHEVEIAPKAVARHGRAVSDYRRLGQTAFLGPRYFAERNTLATLLKTYGAARLAYVLPLFLIVGIAKVIGFIATRRLSDAWQTVRAWIWNLRHLPGTWQRRRSVQADRERTDRELQELFARAAPRARAYAEEFGEWLSGGEIAVEEEVDPTPPPPGRRLRRAIADHPAVVGGFVLAVLGVIAAWPLLAGGALRGGGLAPWPDSPRAFFEAYRSGWNGVGGLGSGAAPSPAQAALGLLGYLAAGSAWLAPRLLVLLPLPVAWLLALRAAGAAAQARLARVAAATAYVLSPPALAALTSGRVGALVTVVALPALVALGRPVVQPRAPAGRAWRAAAALALVLALTVAFEPPFALVAVTGGAVAVVLAWLAEGATEQRRAAVLRVVAVLAGTALLLFPWVGVLLRPGSPVFGGLTPPGGAYAPFWRWLLLTPELPGFPGTPLPGIGLLAAGMLGVALASRRAPLAVVGLWVTALAGVAVAWLAGRAGADAWAWPGLPLLVTVGALAGSLALALDAAAERLAEHAFGWRQVATVVTAAAVVVGVATSAAPLFNDPWGAYAVGQPALPTFLGPEAEQVGPFRILVLSSEAGAIDWDLTGPEGPTMLRFGAPVPEPLIAAVEHTVRDVAQRSDPGAAGMLGVLNVRYVVVPEGGRDPALEAALEDQLDLEPQPVGSGLVYRVGGWLPRVSWVPTRAADSIDERGELPPGTEPVAFEPTGLARYEGAVPAVGRLLVAEVADAGWTARGDGTRLARNDHGGLVRFRTRGAAEDLVVEHARDGRRRLLVSIELVVFLLTVSLVLRPPRFARREARS